MLRDFMIERSTRCLYCFMYVIRRERISNVKHVFFDGFQAYAIRILITFHYQKENSPQSEVIQGPLKSMHSIRTGNGNLEKHFSGTKRVNCNLVHTFPSQMSVRLRIASAMLISFLSLQTLLGNDLAFCTKNDLINDHPSETSIDDA